MLKKCYEQGKDLHVAVYLAYGKTDDHKLYADEALTEGVTNEELADAFVKGRLLICVGEEFFAPVAATNAGVVTVDSTTPSAPAAVIWTVSAEE